MAPRAFSRRHRQPSGHRDGHPLQPLRPRHAHGPGAVSGPLYGLGRGLQRPQRRWHPAARRTGPRRVDGGTPRRLRRRCQDLEIGRHRRLHLHQCGPGDLHARRGGPAGLGGDPRVYAVHGQQRLHGCIRQLQAGDDRRCRLQRLQRQRHPRSGRTAPGGLVYRPHTKHHDPEGNDLVRRRVHVPPGRSGHLHDRPGASGGLDLDHPGDLHGYHDERGRRLGFGFRRPAGDQRHGRGVQRPQRRRPPQRRRAGAAGRGHRPPQRHHDRAEGDHRRERQLQLHQPRSGQLHDRGGGTGGLGPDFVACRLRRLRYRHPRHHLLELPVRQLPADKHQR